MKTDPQDTCMWHWLQNRLNGKTAIMTTRQSTASPFYKKHYTIIIDYMHARSKAHGFGKCENRPSRHLHVALPPEQPEQEDCNTTRQSTASPLCKKHFAITIEDMHAQFQARGLGKCQNGPLRQHLPLSTLHRHTESTCGNMWRSSIVLKLCTHRTKTMKKTAASGMAPAYV